MDLSFSSPPRALRFFAMMSSTDSACATAPVAKTRSAAEMTLRMDSPLAGPRGGGPGSRSGHCGRAADRFRRCVHVSALRAQLVAWTRDFVESRHARLWPDVTSARARGHRVGAPRVGVGGRGAAVGDRARGDG